MPLDVKQRGDHVATFRWIEVRLMETLARWVPTTPETEVKLVFGAHIWDLAQHADSLGKRTHELRLPLQHSLEPSGDFVRYLGAMAAEVETDKRVAGFYDCLLPGLERRFRDYMGQVDQLLDGPTVRILERILFDFPRLASERARFAVERPDLPAPDTQWLAGLAAFDEALPEEPQDALQTLALLGKDHSDHRIRPGNSLLRLKPGFNRQNWDRRCRRSSFLHKPADHDKIWPFVVPVAQWQSA